MAPEVVPTATASRDAVDGPFSRSSPSNRTRNGWASTRKDFESRTTWSGPGSRIPPGAVASVAMAEGA